MRFQLTIELDNAGMSTSVDLATALRNVAKRIERNDYVETCEDDGGEIITRHIQDSNGNNVGKWSVWDELTSMETPSNKVSE